MTPGLSSPVDDRVDARFFPVVVVRAYDETLTPEGLKGVFASLSRVMSRNQPFVVAHEIAGSGNFRNAKVNIPMTVKWLKENAEARKRLALGEALISDSPVFRFVFATVNVAVPVANIRVFPTGIDAVPWLEEQLGKAGLAAPPGAWATVGAVGAPPEVTAR